MYRTIAPVTLCAAGLAGLALLASACQQPLFNCTSAHSPYQALYKLKSGDPNSPCGSLSGDVLTLNTYFQEGGLNGTPDYEHAKVAITATYLSGFLDQAEGWEPPISDPDPKHTRNAIGDFSTGKPVDDFCVVDKLNAAIIDLPELPLIPGTPAVPDDPNTPDIDESEPEVPDTPAVPPQSFRYDWTKLKVLVTADAQGTQLTAHLKYTENGCVAEYDVYAVSPPVDCELYEDEVVIDPDTMQPVIDPETGEPVKESVPQDKPDQDLCDDPSSGLNPDFQTKCTSFGANNWRCAISTNPPVYRE